MVSRIDEVLAQPDLVDPIEALEAFIAELNCGEQIRILYRRHGIWYGWAAMMTIVLANVAALMAAIALEESRRSVCRFTCTKGLISVTDSRALSALERPTSLCP